MLKVLRVIAISFCCLGIVNAESLGKPWLLSGKLSPILSALIPYHRANLIFLNILTCASILAFAIALWWQILSVIQKSKYLRPVESLKKLSWLIFAINITSAWLATFAKLSIIPQSYGSMIVNQYLKGALYYPLRPLSILLTLSLISCLLKIKQNCNDRI
jgi:hypothetical protein